MSDFRHLRLSHARDYLRQAFAFNSGMDPQTYKPLGGLTPDDPEEVEFFRERMEQCRQRAHDELIGYVSSGRLPILGAQDDGKLAIVAPDWAAERFDEGGKITDRLYLTADVFRELWDAIVPPPARTELDWQAAIKPAVTVATHDLIVAEQDAIERQFRETNFVPGAISWDDFDTTQLPALQRLHAAAERDEWWTWPEAIAWIGSRDTTNLATLRYWGCEWSKRTDCDATVTLGTQAFMATQYCDSASGVEAELVGAIANGQVATSGRLTKGAVATGLQPSIWRGGTIIYSEGEAVLVDAKHRLSAWAFDIAIKRQDLMTAFRSAYQPQIEPTGKVIQLAPRAYWTVAEVMIWAADRTDSRLRTPGFAFPHIGAMHLYDAANPLWRLVGRFWPS